MSKDQVAARVRALREALGLSQEALAQRGGVSRVTVAKIEGGHNFASTYATRRALASGFGLSLDDVALLLDGATPIRTLRGRCHTEAA